MKFSEMPYERPDMSALKEQFAALTERLQNAHDYAAARAAFLEEQVLNKHVDTLFTLASVRHTIDTRDKFYDEEMEFAVNSLIEQEGGIVLVKEGKVIESMPMPIAGLMSDQSGEWVDQKLTDIHEKAYEELGICGDVEPVMTLCFMSLAVIPEIKLTDMGLFDVTTFSFIPVEIE